MTFDLTVNSSKVIKFENLPLNQMIKFLDEIEEYTISEKIDGSQLIVGIDDIGFYTSRETKGGVRIYNVDDYEIDFHTTYMRAAHSALFKILPLLTHNGFSNGCSFEVEILYGSRPNVVQYDDTHDHVVFLRALSGPISVEKIVEDLDKVVQMISIAVPYSPEGMTVRNREEISIWDFSGIVQEAVSAEPHARLDLYIEKLKEFDGTRRDLAPLIDVIKDILLHKFVSNRVSRFAKDSQRNWVEGVVFTHRYDKLRFRVKIVDESLFTKVKDFLWDERISLTKKHSTLENSVSVLGKFLTDCAMILGPEHYLLGTTQAKRYMTYSPVIKSQPIDDIKFSCAFVLSSSKLSLSTRLDQFLTRCSSNIMVAHVKGSKIVISYDNTTIQRTLNTYSRMHRFFSDFEQGLNDVRTVDEFAHYIINSW